MNNLMRFCLLVLLTTATGWAVLAASPRRQIKELYIARHGQTEWNRLGRVQGDPDINAVGYEQRVGLYLALKDVGLQAVYTSAKLRSKRTGELTAKLLGIKPRAEADLNEMEGGLFEGLCYSTIGNEYQPPDAQQCRPGGPIDPKDPLVKFLQRERAKRTQDKLAYRPPGGESYLDGAKRIGRFLQRQKSQLARKKVLVVGHGGSNRLLLAQVMGWDVADVVRIRQDNSWIFRVRQDSAGNKVLSLLRDGVWRDCSEKPDPQKGLPCAS